MEQEKRNDLYMNASANSRSSIYADKGLKTNYSVEVRDPLGNVKWVEDFDNIVVTQGLNDSLERHFRAGGYTAAWYVGLASGTPATAAAADTLASRTGWFEGSGYSQATRPPLVFATAPVAGSMASNAAVFSIINDGTSVGGAFMSSGNIIGQTGGVLYGVGAFTTGAKLLGAGDTLNVTVTVTAAAA